MATLRPFREYGENEKVTIRRLAAQIKPMNTDQTPKFATMNEVVMKKDELLNKLIENKAKHDVVLATAIAGYWDMAKAKLEDKHKKLIDSIVDWKASADSEFQKFYGKVEAKEELPAHVTLKMFAVDTSLGLVYPQDHSRDYDKAIRMMQSSIYGEVQLSADEYDAYVLNNWEWKNNFFASNSAYLNTRKGRMLKAAVSPTITGCLVSQYDQAQDTAINLFQMSGCSASNF